MMSPIEPVWPPDDAVARIKSPGQRMHFTAGLPFRILADANDPNAYQCPPGHPPYACPDSSMTFLVDGQGAGTVAPDAANQNLWELRLPRGLPAGDHVLTVKFKPHGAAAIDGLVPIYITVDPVPAHANQINLTADVVLSGTTDLDWTDAVVTGNGHSVRAAAGYRGRVLIRKSFVSGLAAFDSQLGIDVATTGAVEISDSIFEATAPIRLAVGGTAPIAIRNNELRASNYVTYVSADPSKSPILDLSGATTGAKTLQGNRIAAGIVHITAMAGWQIGGLTDALGNLLIGPRCVIQLDGATGATIQGNYLRHDYYGGFSQGFNLAFGGTSDGALAEHNVIRDGSWPVQGFGGELRYNLLINSGHDFLRSTQAGARIHHNVLAHAQAANSGYDGAIFLYDTETGVAIDHNTIDAGGATGANDSPAIVLAAASVKLSSLRGNVFSQFQPLGARWKAKAVVAGADSEATVAAPRITSADANAFWNPAAPASVRYAPGLVAAAPAHAERATAQATRAFQAGVDAYRLGKYDEARAQLGKAIALDAKLPGPHRFLAAVARAQDKWAECIAETRAALVLNPRSAELGDTRRLHDDCRQADGRPPAPAELGEGAALAVTANVTGATVRLGGLRYGGTPLEPRAVRPGTGQVEIDKLGYKSVRLTVELIPGVVTDVAVTLEPLPAAAPPAPPAPPAPAK